MYDLVDEQYDRFRRKGAVAYRRSIELNGTSFMIKHAALQEEGLYLIADVGFTPAHLTYLIKNESCFSISVETDELGIKKDNLLEVLFIQFDKDRQKRPYHVIVDGSNLDSILRRMNFQESDIPRINAFVNFFYPIRRWAYDSKCYLSPSSQPSA